MFDWTLLVIRTWMNACGDDAYTLAFSSDTQHVMALDMPLNSLLYVLIVRCLCPRVWGIKASDTQAVMEGLASEKA